jgi:hypothetical protein
MDPCASKATTAFDNFFPFLVNDDLSTFNVQVNLWFGEADGDVLVYRMNRSDDTQLP